MLANAQLIHAGVLQDLQATGGTLAPRVAST
jgi:hypothetical protein